MLPANVDLTVRHDPALGLVRANAGQMHQVLLNLVVNARDAMPSGGSLVIEVRNADVEAGSPEANAGAREGAHVLLSVSDTGVGMDDDTRQRALEPFFTTKEGTGTGLGLSTVHSIVTECRGRILLESVCGVGTTVRVYLPRLDADAGGDARIGLAPSALALLPARRILVVDEDEAVRQLLLDLLTGAGYIVRAAEDASELGVPGEGESAYDLAVVDLATLERAGASMNSLARVPPKIVGLSSIAGGATAAFANRLNIGATVAKPIGPRRLLRAVRDVLEAD
jgi:two-component system cell cycle sensor histidine kinase/response regulator CckA